MKKILMITLLLLSLTACSNKSIDAEDPFEIISSDINQVRLDGEYIYVLDTLSIDEIINLIEPSSNSDLSFTILNNQGETKSSTIVYDFDILRITNNENKENIDIFIQVITSFK